MGVASSQTPAYGIVHARSRLIVSGVSAFANCSRILLSCTSKDQDFCLSEFCGDELMELVLAFQFSKAVRDGA